MRKARLHKRVLRLEERLLRLQHGDEIDRAFPQTLLGNVESTARACDNFALQAFALCGLTDGIERVFDVGKS
jgi:hypothetical protein